MSWVGKPASSGADERKTRSVAGLGALVVPLMPMRIAVAFFVQLLLLTNAGACDCFSPEQRMKAAQDALTKARVAMLGRVVEVTTSGIAKVVVLESFKGPSKGEVVEARQDFGLCMGASKGQTFSTGEEAFVVSFGPVTTACDKLASDNFLLESFRLIVRGK